jgi:hypothetical protein
LTQLEALLERISVDLVKTVHDVLLKLVVGEVEAKECRLEGVAVLSKLALLHPDLRLPTLKNKRLHDLLFISFCELAVCDSDQDIRCAAFTLVSALQQVDILLVKQSLSKARLEELVTAVPDSACGAFVHGMEDEFERVRVSCMKAIFRHTLTAHQTIVDVVVDPIADSFNDDAASVRLAAVRTLTSICIIHRVRLDLDRAEFTLHLLVDADPEIRAAVRSLLQVCMLQDEECVKAAFKAFIRALPRHPSELDELMVAIGKIGCNHAHIMATLVPTLLRMEKYNVITEPRLEDVNYLLVLVAVLNATRQEPDFLISRLPSFIFKQYHYVRAKFPTACPSLLDISVFADS